MLANFSRKSTPVNPLSRFATKEAIARLLKIKVQQIYRIERRMANKQERNAPDFWVDFYAQKFRQAVSVAELFDWGRLVGVIKLMLPQISVESLRNVYTQEKYVLEHF